MEDRDQEKNPSEQKEEGQRKMKQQRNTLSKKLKQLRYLEYYLLP